MERFFPPLFDQILIDDYFLYDNKNILLVIY